MSLQLIVRDLLSDNAMGNSIVVEAEPATETVFDLMLKLEAKTGAPPIVQRITFNGMSLYHDTPGTLADHGVGPDRFCMQGSHSYLRWLRLQDKTLRGLGIATEYVPADDGDAPPPPPPEGKMRVTVKDCILTGPAGPVPIALDVAPGDTVASVAAEVHRRKGYPPEMQMLTTCDGRTMYHDGGDTLADYDVTDESEVELSMNLLFAYAADVEDRKREKAAMEAAGHEKTTAAQK